MGSMIFSSPPTQGLSPECLVPALSFVVSLFLPCLVLPLPSLCLLSQRAWSFLFFWSRLPSTDFVRDKDENKDTDQISAEIDTQGQGRGPLNAPPHAYPSEESRISAGVLSYDCLVVVSCLVLTGLILYYLVLSCFVFSLKCVVPLFITK